MNIKINEKYLWLFIIFPIGYSFYVFYYANPIYHDGIQYVDLGFNLLHFGEYDSSYNVIPGWLQPPVHPVICGIFSLIFSAKTAGLIVGYIVGVFIIVIIYHFLKNEFNQQIALLTIILIAINPLFLSINLGSLSEPVYTLLYISLFILIYRIYRRKSGLSYYNVSLLSLLSVLLTLTRPEGVFYIFIITIFIIRLCNFKMSFVYLLICGILMIPYGLFIKSKCGSFNILPKFTYNIRLGAVGAVISQRYSPDIMDMDDYDVYIWYAYDPETKTMYGENIMNDEYYKELKKSSMKYKLSNSRLTIISDRIITNLIGVGKILYRSYPFPIFFLIFFIIGFISILVNNRQLLYFIAFWNFSSFYFILSHVEERFFYVMLPFISFIAAVGILTVSKRVTKKINAIIYILLLILLNSFYYYNDLYDLQDENKTCYTVSTMLKTGISPESTICTKPPQITFFGDYKYLRLPICNPDQLYDYLLKNNTNYLILGKEIKSTHRGLIDVYNNVSSLFQLTKSIELNNEIFKVYKIRL